MNPFLKKKKPIFLVFCFVFFIVFSFGGNFSINHTHAQFGDATSAGDSASGVDGFGIRDPQACGDTPGPDSICFVFKGLLYAMIVLFGWILIVATTVFGWIIEPDNVRLVLGASTIGQTWSVVRDFFNLFFILVLLFSAFATIFQVEKFHLKKILLTLVIMALLVNFSFPITRILVDAGNVVMYFLLNQLFPSGNSGAGIFASIAGGSNIANILVPADSAVYTYTYLLMSIIFTALLSFTLIVIALIFLVRLVVLAILIIFSPVGFVASILPSTQKFASDWWDNMFKWSFIGPVMVFMIAIAISFISSISIKGSTGFYQQSVLSAGGSDPSLFAAMAFFTIPIVVLWAGIISGQKIGGSAASFVTSKATSFAKTGGRLVRKGAGGTTKFVGRTAARAPGIKQVNQNVRGLVGGAKQRLAQTRERRQAEQKQVDAHWADKFGVKGAKEKDLQTRSAQYEKDHTPLAELEHLSASGDAAASLSLIKKNKLDETKVQAAIDTQMKADPGVEALLGGELKKKRIDLLIQTKLNNGRDVADYMGKNEGASRSDAEKAIVKKEYGKLDAEKVAGQDWASIEKADKDRPVKQMPQLAQAYENLSAEARAESRKKMSATNMKVLQENSELLENFDEVEKAA